MEKLLVRRLVEVAALVGDDGTGDLGVIVRQALADDADATAEDIAEIIRTARADATVERNRDGIVTSETCVICGDSGGHTSAQHYSTLPSADRPATVIAVRKKIEERSGRTTLEAVMAILGVPRKR